MSIPFIVKCLIAIVGIGLITFAFLFFKKKRKEITLLAVSTGIAIIVCELFLRIFLPQISNHENLFDYDAALGWKFVPNGKGLVIYPGGIRNPVETNSMGFRDRAPSADKKRKILVLGDSFVSNISVKDNEVFTEIMEEQLEKYDVQNFGVSGYGQVQEYLLLQKWIKTIKPDIVLLIIFVQNDFTDNIGPHWRYTRPYATLETEDSILVIHPQPKNQQGKNAKDSLGIFSQSHVNILITRSLNKFFPERDSSYTPPEFYTCESPPSESHNLRFRIMEELLLKIANLGKENDVPVVFALAPSNVQIEDELWEAFVKKNQKNQKKYLRSLPNNRLMEFARRNHLLMLDFFPPLLQESKKKVKLYHHVEQHWTKEGNRVAANALLNFLESKSLLE
jgi:hypothetical protein